MYNLLIVYRYAECSNAESLRRLCYAGCRYTKCRGDKVCLLTVQNTNYLYFLRNLKFLQQKISFFLQNYFQNNI
jgi:hypothetical protein